MMNIMERWVPESIQREVDDESGSVVDQLTSEPVSSTNIYCEQRFASADGARIAISRTPFGGPLEIWVCDLRSTRLCRAVAGEPLGATHSKNAVYYTAVVDGSARLMCLNIAELTMRELYDFGDAPLPKAGAVSPDQRYFVGGPFEVGKNIYALRRIDLRTGESSLFCENRDMFNPHLQFSPSGAKFVIQINRGGQPFTTGKNVSLTGPKGATLAIGDVITGEVAPLPAGKPDTPPISGHEAWIGDSGRLMFSAAFYTMTRSAFVTLKSSEKIAGKETSPAIYSVAPGDAESKVVATGLLFNHLAVSDDGRFFIADDHATGRIHIGRVETGNYRGLCDSLTRQGTCQYSHVHPYMTPDQKYVIFNSIATGCAQVYAASIPDGFLKSL
ncbi:MAG: hypothetical protein KAG97_03385 [Victivallales bacterium]|nr:hypothetical protein [Victivallales bacterium]